MKRILIGIIVTALQVVALGVYLKAGPKTETTATTARSDLI